MALVAAPAPTDMGVVLGARAHALLADAEFRHRWQALAERCPWGTVYQSVPFASTWYECYRDRYEPLLIFDSGPSGLSGLFLLARSRFDGSLAHVGTSHAEYQAWLATPEHNTAFVVAAVRACRSLGARALRLHFAAPKMPLDWIGALGSIGAHATVQMHRRGLMTINGGGPQVSLKKPGNRRKIARLGRMGSVVLEQLHSRQELAEVFDRIIDYCDLRQGAIHSTMPFRDDVRKRDFYLALMDQPGLLHATVLRAGPDVVAAHIGPVDREYVSLGLVAHSPFVAADSPGKLLLLLLGERLAQQGYELFDLTPGGEYKDRFATAEDQVPSIAFALSSWECIRHRGRRLAVRAGLNVAARAGLDGGAVVSRVATHLRRANPYQLAAGAARTAARGVARWTSSAGEFLVYRMSADRALGLTPTTGRLRMNCLADLLQYAPSAAFDPTPSAFLAEALRRLEEGQLAFTHADGGLLLHAAWLIPTTERAGSDFGHRYAFGERAAVLWATFTHPLARGRGLQQESLIARAHYAAVHQLAPSIVTGVRADNGPSRHNIEKIGFEHVASAFIRRRLGRTERWLEGEFLREVPPEAREASP